MGPENSCLPLLFPRSERTDASLLEPRTGETPQLYVQRLTENIYLGESQRSVLEAYRLCFEIGTVGQVCIRHYPDLPLSRAHELYDQESLAEVCTKAGQAKGTMDEQDWDSEFCFGASLRLNPEVANQAMTNLNVLAYRLRTDNPTLHQESLEPFHSKALNTLARAPLAVFVLRFLPGRLRQQLLLPMIREDLSLGTWMRMFRDQDNEPHSLVKKISLGGEVELSDFELQASSSAALDFLRHGIDVKVAFHLDRLVDEYYQLSGKLFEHRQRYLLT